MNTKRMKSSNNIAFLMALLLIFSGIFSSCTKEENEDTSSISGQWKLLEVYYWDWEPISIDYSQNDIIYDFKENNVLAVSGKMDNINDYRGHKKGNYSYKLLPIPPSGPTGPDYCPQMKIGNTTHGFSFGWVFYDYYEGSAMHLETKKGCLVLVRVEEFLKIE